MADRFYTRGTSRFLGDDHWIELDITDVLINATQRFYDDCQKIQYADACSGCPFFNNDCIEDDMYMAYIAENKFQLHKRLKEFQEYADEVLDQCECTEQQEADEKAYREWADERAIGD